MVSQQANPLRPVPESAHQSAHVAALSESLARSGHHVIVYTRRTDPDVPERERAPEGYTVVHVPVGPFELLPDERTLPLMGEFGGFLEGEWDQVRPDIVHAHFWMSGIATQLATKMLGIPVVQTFHTLGAVEARSTERTSRALNDRIRLEQLIARGSTRILATSADEVFELAHMGIPRQRTTIVPHGVDVDLFSPHGPAAERGELRRILMVGDVDTDNGFAAGIEALKRVPDAELTIAGGVDGDAASAAKKLASTARRHRVADRVTMLGSVDDADLPALLRSADVVVCAPEHTSDATLALRAMSCGIPVVGTAVGALREVVSEGATGRIVPTGSARRLADSISSVLDDPAVAKSFGAAARERVEQRYSRLAVAEEALRAYSRCVSAPPRTRMAPVR
ncbi:glycosyltransferase [Rhodococcus rhodnii]|nr:glycosyltransferase [Rhodococcus rhodnii]